MARSKSRPAPAPPPAPDPPAGAAPGADGGGEPATFGARLKMARDEAGWGFLEAARKLDIRPQRLAEYESGKRMPPIPKLMEIVRVLGLDASTILPEWFAGWERKKNNPRKSRE